MFRTSTGAVLGWCAVFAAAGSVGCSAGDPAVDKVGHDEEAVAVAGPACPTNRAIWLAPHQITAIAPIAGKGGVWNSEPLFPAPQPPGLAGYWSFVWTSASGVAPIAPDFTALAAYAATVSAVPVQRDCAAVTALASTTDTVWPVMRAKNGERTSKLATLPSGGSAVRVAVVDSAATTYASTTNDTFDHGRTVGRAIRELSCPSDGAGGIATARALGGPGGAVPIGGSAPCVGQISNYAALVHVTPTVTDTVHGGYFGTQSELALSIVRAVNGWLAEPAATRPAHLLVNLSLGWDNDQGYGGEYATPTTLPPATRAVHAAISHAVCRGALVVVAAGNRSTPTSSGPMYPAQWEAHAAPTAAECAAFEGVATLPADPAAVTYRPLVHAVGALDAVDAPLATTRPLGRPRIAAYGENVVTSDPRGVHTDMLSGTSMAAANVSGIAAAVWGYKPGATANEVMQLVYDNAVALTDAADFSFATPRPVIRRASLCDSVKAAIHGSFACATSPAYSGKPVSLDWPSLDPGFAMEPIAAGLASASSLPTSPGGVSAPWVTSQPGSPSCTTCAMKGRQAYVGTNPGPPGYVVGAGVITLKTKVTSGATVTEYYAFAPPAATAANAANYAVALAPSPVTGTVTSATVTWGVTGTSSSYQTTAPLALVP